MELSKVARACTNERCWESKSVEDLLPTGSEHAAAGADVLSGDPAAVIGDQERHDVGDVLRFAETAQRGLGDLACSERSLPRRLAMALPIPAGRTGNQRNLPMLRQAS
jgi:hypothetical protein